MDSYASIPMVWDSICLYSFDSHSISIHSYSIGFICIHSFESQSIGMNSFDSTSIGIDSFRIPFYMLWFLFQRILYAYIPIQLDSYAYIPVINNPMDSIPIPTCRLSGSKSYQGLNWAVYRYVSTTRADDTSNRNLWVAQIIPLAWPLNAQYNIMTAWRT